MHRILVGSQWIFGNLETLFKGQDERGRFPLKFGCNLRHQGITQTRRGVHYELDPLAGLDKGRYSGWFIDGFSKTCFEVHFGRW